MTLCKEDVEKILKHYQEELPSAIDNGKYRSAVIIYLLEEILQQLRKMSHRP